MTGLRNPEVMDGVVQNVMKCESVWLGKTTEGNRLKFFKACVYKAYEAIGLPRIPIEFDLACAPTDLGSYSFNDCRLILNATHFSDRAVGADQEMQLADCLDTLYHESRHFEQHYRLTRYRIRHALRKYLEGDLRAAKLNPKVKFDGPRLLVEDYGVAESVSGQLWSDIVTNRPDPNEIEVRNWFLEVYNADGVDINEERKQIMDDFAAPGNKRKTVRAYYRGLHLEMDGHAAGYEIEERYLKQSALAAHNNWKELNRRAAQFVLGIQKINSHIAANPALDPFTIVQLEDKKKKLRLAGLALKEEAAAKQIRGQKLGLGYKARVNAHAMDTREYSDYHEFVRARDGRPMWGV